MYFNNLDLNNVSIGNKVFKILKTEQQRFSNGFHFSNVTRNQLATKIVL